MPRDLEALAKEDSLQGMPAITKSPETMEDSSNRPTLIDMDDEEHMINQLSQRNDKRDELHPYTQTLKESDIESCVTLEEATFPENERCTREKVSPNSTLLPAMHSSSPTSITPLCHRDISVAPHFCMRCRPLPSHLCFKRKKEYALKWKAHVISHSTAFTLSPQRSGPLERAHHQGETPPLHFPLPSSH